MSQHSRIHSPISVALLVAFFFLPSMLFAQTPDDPPAVLDRNEAEALLVETLKREPAELLDSGKRTTVVQQEKAHSLALFGKGRLLFQQERYDEALAAYERAWLWNPDATSILHEIVRLTFHLERHGAAVRYAILANERAPRDPEMMQQLSMVLAQDGEPGRGLDLLKKALQLRPEPRDQTFAEMHFNILRLAALSKREKEALDSIKVIRQAHANPEDFEIANEDIEESIGDPKLVHGLFVEILVEAGEYDQAERAIRKLAELEEGSSLVDYYRGRLALKRGDPKLALTHLEKYAADKGTSAGEDAYKLLDDALTEDGIGSKVIAVRFQTLVDGDPTNAALAIYAARKSAAIDDAESVQVLLEPFATEPDLDVIELMIESYANQRKPGPLVVLLGRITDTFGSLSAFKKQIEQITGNEELLDSILAEADRRMNDRRRPMIATESLGCAYLALAAKKLDLSEKFFAHAEKNLPEEELTTTRLGYAEECFFSEQNQPAIRIFRDILKNPGDEVNVGSVIELLAMAQEYDGQTQEALATIETYLEELPSIGLAVRRAWVLYHANRNDLAREAYAKVLADYADNYDSDSTRRTLKDAKMVLSNLYVAADDHEAGIEMLLQVLDEFPEDIGAMNDLGYLWADNDLHLEKSLAMIKQAIAAEPDNAAYLDSLAWVYMKMDQPAKALPLLEQAIADKEDPDGVILDHLGDVHMRLGSPAKAVAYWEQSLGSLRKSELVDKAKEVESKIHNNSNH